MALISRAREAEPSALRQQTDWRRPTIDRRALAPPGRRLADVHFVCAESASGRTLELGRSRRTIDHAAPASAARFSQAKGLKDQRNSWFVCLFGAAVQPRGHRRSMALKDQRFRGGVCLNGAYFPRAARGAPSALRQQTDWPTHIRPTRFGTAWAAAARRRTTIAHDSGSGRTMELGRSRRMMMMRRRPRRAVQPAKGLKDQRNSWFVCLFGAAVQPRGHRRSMALKDQRFRGGVCLNGAYFPRAGGGAERAPPADRLAPTHDQTDALWHRLGGGWPTSNFVCAKSASGRTLELGRSRRTIDHAARRAGERRAVQPGKGNKRKQGDC